MKFYALTQAAPDPASLEAEYKAGHAIGVIRVGSSNFFFRAKRKVYFIPYADITRCFRRVMLVPARMCCGRGNLSVETLVICGAEEKELAQIQVPGDKAAKALLEELKQKMPDIPFVKPPKQSETAAEG